MPSSELPSYAASDRTRTVRTSLQYVLCILRGRQGLLCKTGRRRPRISDILRRRHSTQTTPDDRLYE
ncbi:hypothetical protein BS17DRAFT_781577 [Gyrodon lividus]|nr:hypothetical protein BS17DRAFT_781577 [Gyrodon lividus]